MTAAYFQTLFGNEARALQEQAGSRSAYARMEAGTDPDEDALGGREISFLQRRDSFYMATVTQDGWPYVQHRGGPSGFVKVLGPRRIAFAELPGNRQFISLGNLATDDRVALFFMDYSARRRLKIIGHAALVDPEEVMIDRAPGVDRAIAIQVVGHDWNCPHHITPRYSAAEGGPVVEALQKQVAELRAEVARLRAQ